MFKKLWRKFRKLVGMGQFSSVADLASHYNNNIEGFAYWLEQNVIYTPDMKPQDHWQPAEVTIKRRKGDCEDNALVALAVLKIWGWPACVICMWPKEGVGHAICVFRRPGYNSYSCLDNGILRDLKCHNISDVLFELKPEWARMEIVRSHNG